MNPNRTSNRSVMDEAELRRRQEALDRAWILQRDDERFYEALMRSIDPIGYGHWNED
jgi:hypothetical protein